MTKLLTMLLISVLLTSSGTSQTASNYDSTKIPNTQLKKAINIIETGKVLRRELALTQKKVVEQDSLISLKDNRILELKKVSMYQDSMIVGYKGAIVNMQKIVANSEEAFTLQKKKYNRERGKKWGTLILGVAFGFFVLK